MRIAIYARLSDDRDGRSTGVDRQLEACRQYAASQGWEVTAEFTDTDLSAFRVGVVRPGYEEMISRLSEFDAVLVWKLDRLVRRFLEFARVWPMFAEQKTSLVSATEPIDTSSAVGRIIVLMLVGFAELESENISLRQRAKHAELARQGRPSGGRRAFGVTEDWTELVPEEVDLIREAAERVIAGEGLVGIVRDWNGRGLVTAGGGRWRETHLRRLLLSERLVGRRRGQVAKNGPMPVILPSETFEAVAAVLRAPGRRTLVSPGRKYLLSGFLTCGRCGANLLTHSNGRLRTYMCLTRTGGCGKVGIAAEALEAHVESELLELLDSSRIQPVSPVVKQDVLRKLQADETALAELTRVRFVERLITDEEYRVSRAELVKRIETEKARLVGPPVMPRIDGKAREVWASADLHRRRAIIGAVVDQFVIHPATRRGRGLDTSRVEPLFRV